MNILILIKFERNYYFVSLNISLGTMMLPVNLMNNATWYVNLTHVCVCVCVNNVFSRWSNLTNIYVYYAENKYDLKVEFII